MLLGVFELRSWLLINKIVICIATLCLINCSSLRLGRVHVVQKGDTLYSIAKKYQKNVATLARINNINSNNLIYPGKKLQIESGFIGKINPVIGGSRQKHQQLSTKTSNPRSINQNASPVIAQVSGNTINNIRSNNSALNNLKEPIIKKNPTWGWPAKGKISKSFAVGELGKNHGLDILGNKGDPILAVADGKVVYAGSNLRGYGKLIIIKHTQDLLSAYAHNDQILVKEKQLIYKGQKIATMGKTDSNTVKLHFEVRYKGKPIDPAKILP